MRKILVLAAMVAAVGMASRLAEARDRGFGSRHFSWHAGPKMHLRHHGFNFHHGGFFGKPRHFGHFGHRGFVFKFGDHDGFVFKFGHVPHFEPRHFGHFGHKGRFRDHQGFGFRFGHIPPYWFGLGHGGPFFEFGHPGHFEPWHRRGVALGKAWRFRSGHVMGFDDSFWSSEPSPHGAVPGPASFEAVLKQLEDQGFRHVPRLLRARSHWQPGT
jgi:hypothetical protein